MRVKITLRCNECKQRNYNTMKNKKNTPDKLELNKYCPFCRKHTVHTETKESEGETAMAEEKKVKDRGRWFREMKSELKKVVWPSKEDTKTNTVVVLVTVAIAAVVMIALDAIFGGILGLIIGA